MAAPPTEVVGTDRGLTIAAPPTEVVGTDRGLTIAPVITTFTVCPPSDPQS